MVEMLNIQKGDVPDNPILYSWINVILVDLVMLFMWFHIHINIIKAILGNIKYNQNSIIKI